LKAVRPMTHAFATVERSLRLHVIRVYSLSPPEKVTRNLTAHISHADHGYRPAITQHVKVLHPFEHARCNDVRLEEPLGRRASHIYAADGNCRRAPHARSRLLNRNRLVPLRIELIPRIGKHSSIVNQHAPLHPTRKARQAPPARPLK